MPNDDVSTISKKKHHIAQQNRDKKLRAMYGLNIDRHSSGNITTVN